MELTKYGEVKDIQLPTEGPGTCNVYVKFTEVQQARVARAALQGRKFGEGSVDVWFYDPSKFESRTWEDMKVVVSSALHCMPARPCVHAGLLPACACACVRIALLWLTTMSVSAFAFGVCACQLLLRPVGTGRRSDEHASTGTAFET